MTLINPTVTDSQTFRGWKLDALAKYLLHLLSFLFVSSISRMMDGTTRKMDLSYLLVLPSKINYYGSTDRLSVWLIRGMRGRRKELASSFLRASQTGAVFSVLSRFVEGARVYRSFCARSIRWMDIYDRLEIAFFRDSGLVIRLEWVSSTTSFPDDFACQQISFPFRIQWRSMEFFLAKLE